MENNTLLLLISSALYGATMKVADLLDEHGFRWFKYADTVFGLLWGIFGSLIITMGDVYVANIILAMVLAFIIRIRIDYRNHAIATVLIIITFLIKGELNVLFFSFFTLIFCVCGSIRDWLDDKLKRGDWLKNIFESGWYYPVPTLIFAFVTKNWLVFYVFLVFIFFYDVVKYLAEAKIKLHDTRSN